MADKSIIGRTFSLSGLRPFLALVLIACLGVSCSLPKPKFTLPSLPANEQAICTVTSASLASPIVLTIPGHTQPVTTLAFADKDATLHVVHAGVPGTLSTWRLGASPRLVRQTIINQVGRRGAQFNATGSRLVVTAGRPDTERYVVLATPLDRLGTDLTGVQVWDPASGELLQHFWNDTTRLPAPHLWPDAALSSDGSLVLNAALAGYHMVEAATGKGGCSLTTIIENQLDQTTTAVGFAPQGGVFAVGGTHGYVDLYRLGSKPGYCGDLGGLRMGVAEVALRFAFHPTAKRFAVLSNRSLWVAGWPVSLFSRARRIPRSESYLGDLQFSPDGRWLAVATPNGVELRRYPGLEVVASDPEIIATAVDFSETDCTLAAGDENGVVRLYRLQR